MAESYFTTSEQLPCKVYLAAGDTQQGWRAAALVIERIAGAGDVAPEISEAEQEEAWRTAAILADTVTTDELLDDALTPERLLYRLFHGEGVAVDRRVSWLMAAAVRVPVWAVFSRGSRRTISIIWRWTVISS